MAIGANWAEVWAAVWGPVWTQEAAEPAPEVAAPTPAGRSRRRRRLYVEIDGQQFDVESVQHAQALLDRAKALAPQAAEEAAERAATVTRIKATKAAKVPRIEVKPPSIAASPDLSIDLTDVRKQIERVYAETAMALEMRLLLQRQAEQDEEEAIFLLM